MNKKLLIIIGGVVLIGLLIFIFVQSSNPNFEESDLVYETGMMPGVRGLGGGYLNGNSEVARSEAIFLQQIQQLQNITFSESKILDDPGFKRLNDNTVTLEEIPAGRSNPFNPIGIRSTLDEFENQYNLLPDEPAIEFDADGENSSSESNLDLPSDNETQDVSNNINSSNDPQ